MDLNILGDITALIGFIAIMGYAIYKFKDPKNQFHE